MTAVLANLNQYLVFHRGDLLPLQPNSLWQIEQGVVRTSTWTEAGDLRTLGYWGAGEIVGQPLSRLAPYQVECLTGVVEVSSVPSHRWPQVLEAILLHGQQIEELLSILQEGCFSLRLLNLLKWFARKFGRQVGQGELIDLRLTHQELADVLGTTRVTVTRLLKQFDQEGLIRRRQNQIILHPSASLNRSFRPLFERVVQQID